MKDKDWSTPAPSAYKHDDDVSPDIGAAEAPASDHDLRQFQARFYQRKEAAVGDLHLFFQESASKLVTLTLEVNVMDLLMIQRALAHFLDDWEVVMESRYDHEEAVLTKRLAVETAPGEHDFVIRLGRQFWTSPEGRGLVVDWWASEDRSVQESEVTFTLPVEEHGWFQQMLPKFRAWADHNHFLRNQAITAEGKFLQFSEHVRWDDVVLSEELRSTLERNCISLLTHAPLYRANGVPLRRGIVLHGPPGTGKTMIGRALAQHCKITFILVTPGMLKGAADVRRVFKWGRRFAPTILFFEDFDLVASSRHNSGSREMLGEFLSQLDGLDSHEGVIAIATTNDLKSIEPALKDRPNRFDCVLEVSAPGLAERRQFLEKWTLRNSGSEKGTVGHTFTIDQLAEQTDGFTGAQMQELCRLAVFEAVEEQVARGDYAVVRLPLSDQHFRAAIRRLGVRRRKRIGFQAADTF